MSQGAAPARSTRPDVHPAIRERRTPARPRRGGRRALFSVPFTSRMTDADLARLRGELDLATYLSPKPGVSGASPGVVPLDFWSGLFLVRGQVDGEWSLEARTWGNPPEPLVHDWNVRAALAARQLDPRVPVPPRAPSRG